jgi:multidrug resistance efflux pump
MNIPNLRQKASNYFNSLTRRLIGLAPKYFIDIRPKEKKFLFVYSILSALYIYWILGSIIIWFGNFMTTNYQGWGFTIYAASLAVFFRQPLSKSLSPATSGIRSFLGLHRIPPFIRWFVLLIAMAFALFYIQLQLKISGTFTVMPHHNADVRAEVDGIIAEVLVDEGDLIKEGTVIAKLSDRDYNADLRKTQADIESKEADLKLLRIGPRSQEIAVARMQVQKTNELFQLAQGQLARDQILMDKKTISLYEYERTKQEATIREKDFGEAKGKLDLLLAGSRQENIEAIEATIKSLRAHESYLQEQLQSLIIKSPIDGIVTTHKPKERIGENVKKGDLITEVYELKTVMVEIAVPEKEIGDVSIGQKVNVKARAYPHLSFQGTVVKIAPVATKPKEEWVSDRTILVTTQIDNAAGLLKPEMTGNAKIYCGEHRLIDLLSRRFVRYFRVEFWSWW